MQVPLFASPRPCGKSLSRERARLAQCAKGVCYMRPADWVYKNSTAQLSRTVGKHQVVGPFLAKQRIGRERSRAAPGLGQSKTPGPDKMRYRLGLAESLSCKVSPFNNSQFSYPLQGSEIQYRYGL